MFVHIFRSCTYHRERQNHKLFLAKPSFHIKLVNFSWRSFCVEIHYGRAPESFPTYIIKLLYNRNG
jgi:hypothetical protein